MVLMPVPVNPPQMPTTSRVGLSHLHGIREADMLCNILHVGPGSLLRAKYTLKLRMRDGFP